MLTETAPQGRATAATDPVLTCRLCGSAQLRSFVDLGATPPCELFLTAEAVEQPEVTYPLHVRVCEQCLLAQLPPLITPEETFTEYAYFSSFSTSWVEHARRFVDGAEERLGLGPESFVVEVASNDGYLLQHVVGRGIRCLGIEPSVNVGEVAGKGVPTLGVPHPETGAQVQAERPAPARRAEQRLRIPDVVGFTQGLRSLVADDGWVSIEVQHLLTLVQRTQFDTIYHEHFQYYGAHRAARARSRPAGWRWSTSSCSTPTAGRSGCGRGRPRSPTSRRRPSATCWPPSRRPGCTPRRVTTGSPRPCRGCVTTWSPS